MAASILCLIVLLLEIRALTLTRVEGKWWYLAVFYTQISNLLGTLSSALLVLFGQPEWVTCLRYLSVCMLVMTFFVTACILVPMGGNAKVLLWSGSGLYHHVLCPLLSTLSYLFLERHARVSLLWLPVAVTLAYGITMLCLNGARLVDGPYPFFRVHDQTAARTAWWILALMVLITALSALVLLAAR